MNPCLLLAAKTLLCLALSLVVLRVLSRPLRDTLDRLCPDAQAAAFWLCYTRLMMVIAPLLLVLVVDLFSRHAEPLDGLRFALMATLAGLLVGLRAIGRRLGRFIVVPLPTKEAP